MVARTTSARVGQTILNHSARTPRIKSIIFFIDAPIPFVFYIWYATVPKFMAGAEGIEPSSAVLETDVLPLNHAPESTTNPAFLRIWFERTPNIPVKISTLYRKIKRKHYKYFVNSRQVFF